jgi:hypothetical protein
MRQKPRRERVKVERENTWKPYHHCTPPSLSTQQLLPWTSPKMRQILLFFFSSGVFAFFFYTQMKIMHNALLIHDYYLSMHFYFSFVHFAITLVLFYKIVFLPFYICIYV